MVNLINSVITSGNSFVGVININGNLNGNILVPADFINQLLASNVPTTTITTTALSNKSSAVANINNNQSINNNINATATSGGATEVSNTTAGDATSGNAATNVTAFNLTGSNVIGSNDLIVFVNVLGKWVGMIMNAPAGTTAASLGGGITQDTANVGNSTTNVTNNDQINNNINVNAQSGNAGVDRNTTAGDATSGNASAAVNLLNVSGSNLSLANWFGVLFINVFGSWNGSFGVDTPPAATSTTSTTTSSGSGGGTNQTLEVFHFSPNTSSSGNGSTSPASGSSAGSTAATGANVAKVLGSTTKNKTLGNAIAKSPQPSKLILSAFGSGFMGIALLGTEQVSSARKRRHLKDL